MIASTDDPNFAASQIAKYFQRISYVRFHIKMLLQVQIWHNNINKSDSILHDNSI